ncbi:MAG: riboflavin synthase [Bacteroidota bacterium]
MFTGLIQYVGTVKSQIHIGSGIRFSIEIGALWSSIKIGDSIAINGVCLTVVKKRKPIVELEAVEETLRKTTLENFKIGQKINCELPLRPNDFVGGHFVLGHTDCVGKIIAIKKLSSSWLYSIKMPEKFVDYIISRGSIAIDGISLTIAEKEKNIFRISIIPHTFAHTNFSTLTIGSEVNLEFDVLGKYIIQSEIFKQKV